jgi:sulfite exporter TauE/SafE
MAWLAIGSGLALGLGSVAHCAGMCGPIAMVLPFQKENGRYDWLSFSVYHTGRISAYLSIGLLIGWLGEMIRWQGLRWIFIPDQWNRITALRDAVRGLAYHIPVAGNSSCSYAQKRLVQSHSIAQ